MTASTLKVESATWRCDPPVWDDAGAERQCMIDPGGYRIIEPAGFNG
jgi:hypothetical protein